jgi:large subunit ribosomal protein L2
MKQFLSKYKNNIKYLTTKKKKYAGRNNTGRITVSHQGGGHKRIYRNIEFKTIKQNGVVIGFEYDPNRSSHIAKICYLENKKKYYYYILPSKNLTIFDTISSENKPNSKNESNFYFLKDLNVGDSIYNLELQVNKGAQIARSAGVYAQILSKTKNNEVHVKLPSGEHRSISGNCQAALGVVNNESHKNKV